MYVNFHTYTTSLIYNEVKESSIYYNVLHPSHGKHMMAPYQKVDK